MRQTGRHLAVVKQGLQEFLRRQRGQHKNEHQTRHRGEPQDGEEVRSSSRHHWQRVVTDRLPKLETSTGPKGEAKWVIVHFTCLPWGGRRPWSDPAGTASAPDRRLSKEIAATQQNTRKRSARISGLTRDQTQSPQQQTRMRGFQRVVSYQQLRLLACQDDNTVFKLHHFVASRKARRKPRGGESCLIETSRNVPQMRRTASQKSRLFRSGGVGLRMLPAKTQRGMRTDGRMGSEICGSRIARPSNQQVPGRQAAKQIDNTTHANETAGSKVRRTGTRFCPRTVSREDLLVRASRGVAIAQSSPIQIKRTASHHHTTKPKGRAGAWQKCENRRKNGPS